MTRVACFFFVVSLVLTQCRETNKYDDSRFVKFLAVELSQKPEKLIVVVLQNEECICTVENMNLTVDIFLSPQYSDFKKILIVKSNHHKVLEHEKLDKESVQIFVNDKAVLDKYGVYFSTDRVFVYSNGKLETHDLHVESVAEIRDKLI